jgi:putative aldouronate transport system permease protein
MTEPAIKRKGTGFLGEIKKNKAMYIMTLPGILYFIIFAYLPMVGIVIAFQDYNPIRGIFGSPFVGFDNFRFFFLSGQWRTVMFNTLYLNFLFIAFGMSFAILLAIMLSELGSKQFKKIGQSIMILPHFVSWPIAGMMVIGLLATNGLVNSSLASMGFERIGFYTTAEVWPPILVILRIWKGAGFSSIIYLAAITGIDQEIYESARIDGASRVQMIFRITLPLLKATAILLLLFSIGGIFRGDFGMIYTIIGDQSRLYPTTDVIDTFVFRMLRVAQAPGMGASVGLLQSFLGFIMVLGSNALARKFAPESAIF